MTDEAKSSVGGRAKLWHSPWELLINKEGFQYPKNDYANGAWLKQIKIEISRVHGLVIHDDMLWAVHNNLAMSEWIIHARFQFVLCTSDWQIVPTLIKEH